MASITCGGCKGTHPSVAAVKACYAAKAEADAEFSTENAEVAETEAAKYRPNRYAGTCYLCANRVEEKAGAVERGPSGWTVRHLDQECPVKAATPDAPATASPARPDYSEVAGGYYATVSATGNNDFDFWFVKEGRKPGYRFVKRVIGGQGPTRIGTAEALRALEAILTEGVDKCGDRFADEMERCRKCGLPLTDGGSRAARMGPVCRSK